MSEKKKILLLSDHALSTSGVGCQSRFLMTGLIEKGDWTVRQLGAAIKHTDYETVVVNEDFIIKPIDGFGDRSMLRTVLATEKPDLLLIFTDPRFFIWLWEMEDEIHQICPIAYWHVWDNRPRPDFNDVLYESTDLINCHSHVTYEIVKEKWPDRTNFIPHALPDDVFFPIPDKDTKVFKEQIVGKDKVDDFLFFWVNRNAKRKRPGDLLWAWKLFQDKLKARGEKKKAHLFLHTDPYDQEGPNLVAITEHLGIVDSVIMSPERIEFEKMNILHNVVDCTIQISYAEGFGLSTLESMQVGNPIIATKTGGLIRQVVDHRDGTENGVALPIEFKTLVGSQSVPYIYEDYTSVETISEAILKIFDMDPEDRKKLGQKARDYVMSEFKFQSTIDMWHDALTKLVDDWNNKKDKDLWAIREL